MPQMRNIDMDLLRSFVTIVEVKSFTRAAERLYRTQSAVSLQMKRLEEQLGSRLFERGGRGVLPTQAGSLLLGYARRILAANDELFGRMTEPEVEGAVSIGATDGYAAEHLTSALARFVAVFPRTGLKVVTGSAHELDAELASGRLDMQLSTVIEGQGERSGAVLAREALFWCAAQGAGALPAESDAPLSLVMKRRGCPIREVAESRLMAAGISWELRFEAESRASVQAGIGSGLGIGVLSSGSLLAGIQRVGEGGQLPKLPDLVTMLEINPEAGPAARRLHLFLLNSYDYR